jgi:hypothetical protein
MYHGTLYKNVNLSTHLLFKPGKRRKYRFFGMGVKDSRDPGQGFKARPEEDLALDPWAP